MSTADLDLWRRRQAAGDPNPWSEALRFLDDGAQPALLDSSYLTAADRANADIMANVEAIAATAALITWAAEDDDEQVTYGYWRGPQDAVPGEAPIVLYDSEGQFQLTYGTNLSEALCYEYGEYADGGFEGRAQLCRAVGVDITVDSPDDFAEPSAEVTPGDFHELVYRRQRAQEA